MTGRFSGYNSLEQLKAFYPIDKATCEIIPDANAAPAQEILAIFKDGGKNRLDKFHWGLVPFSAKDVSIGYRMINARAESVAEKPAFRDAFRNRRCLIPADGFYEWKSESGKKKPVLMTLPDKKPFAFAGLWETWQNRNDDSANYRSCAIITTRASESFRAVHHRMPVILKPRVYETWLDPKIQNPVELVGLLKYEIIRELVSVPLSQPGGAIGPDDSAGIKAVNKPQQTEFDWPEDGNRKQ
jgi:putative SOS response-associated peptidase YedK